MASEQDSQPVEDASESPRGDAVGNPIEVPAEAPPEVSAERLQEFATPGQTVHGQDSQPFDPDTRPEGGNPNRPRDQEEGSKD